MNSAVRILIFSLIVSFIFSCRQDNKPDAEFENYKEYVNHHHDHPDQYYNMKWSDLNREHNELQQKAEQNIDHWSDRRKAEYEEVKLNWVLFRENYVIEADRREIHARNEELLKSFLPVGIHDDMSNVTNANISRVYRQFVSRTKELSDSLTREQWAHVELLWDRLEKRKSELEHTLNGEAKLAVAEHKMIYGTLKSEFHPTGSNESGKDKK